MEWRMIHLDGRQHKRLGGKWSYAAGTVREDLREKILDTLPAAFLDKNPGT
jgi:hypothetical protein